MPEEKFIFRMKKIGPYVYLYNFSYLVQLCNSVFLFLRAHLVSPDEKKKLWNILTMLYSLILVMIDRNQQSDFQSILSNVSNGYRRFWSYSFIHKYSIILKTHNQAPHHLEYVTENLVPGLNDVLSLFWRVRKFSSWSFGHFVKFKSTCSRLEISPKNCGMSTNASGVMFLEQAILKLILFTAVNLVRLENRNLAAWSLIAVHLNSRFSSVRFFKEAKDSERILNLSGEQFVGWKLRLNDSRLGICPINWKISESELSL